MKTIQKSVPVQTVLFLLMDAIFIIVAGGLALLVRFDFDFEQVPSGYLEPWFRALPVQFLVTAAVFWPRRMYRYLWRYVSAHDVAEMVISVVLAYCAFHVPAALFGYHQPRSVLFMELLFQLFLRAGAAPSAFCGCSQAPPVRQGRRRASASCSSARARRGKCSCGRSPSRRS